MVSRLQLWFGSGLNGILIFLITIFCVFFSLSFHEFSRAYIAHKLGDDTAKNMGRLTLNPITHLDPIGALCMLLFGFGWGRPVPVNPNNFDTGKYKYGMTLISLIGPISSFFLAFVSVFLSRILDVVSLRFFMNSPDILSAVITIANILCINLAALNIGFAIFNLIPIPPLPGSMILKVILPARTYYNIMQYEQYGIFALIILINIPFFSNFISMLINYIQSFFYFIVRLLPFL